MIRSTLLVAMFLAGSYSAALLAVFFAAVAARARRGRARSAAEHVRPKIAAAVVDFAGGNDDTSAIREFAKDYRDLLEQVLLQYHATLSGDGRSRLADLALDLGLVHRWRRDAESRSPRRRGTALSRLAMVAGHEPSRRVSGDILHRALQDADPDARLEAARTLVHSGEMDEIAEVFHAATVQSPFVRVVLADDLRRHSMDLCKTAIPEALRSDDPARVLAALEIIAAWQRAAPIEHVYKLMEHKERRIRLAALRILPLTPMCRESAEAVHRALCEEDDDLCIRAADAAARMKLESALPHLARCLRRGRVDLCRAAAAALAGMPPRGWETLEELSAYGDPVTASAAHEALERARKLALEA